MRKGEIACYKQFHLFSQYFPKLYIFSASKCVVMGLPKLGFFHNNTSHVGSIPYLLVSNHESENHELEITLILDLIDRQSKIKDDEESLSIIPNVFEILYFFKQVFLQIFCVFEYIWSLFYSSVFYHL